MILRHITEAGGGGRGRSVSTITAIGQTVVIATVVKKSPNEAAKEVYL